MDRATDVADHDKLDRVANLLMASLRESKTLNNHIRKALHHREQNNALELLGHTVHGADVFQLLHDLLKN
jgi:hypothetical protein